MARKLYIVFADTGHNINQSNDYAGMFVLRENKIESDLGIFTRQTHAERFAETVSLQNPGVEVYIFESTSGVYAPPPGKVQRKVWKDGEYTPL